MKVYLTEICIHCRNFMHLMKLRGLELEVVNITENTTNLKEFLRLRDHNPVLAPRREAGGIGIPCFTDGDWVSLDPNEALARLGQPPVREDEILERRD